MSAGPDRADDTVGRLIKVLRSLPVDQSRLPDEGLETARLRGSGLDSGAFVSFLTAIEAEFGVVWDLDVPSQTFDSLRSIAGYLDGSGAAAARPAALRTVPGRTASPRTDRPTAGAASSSDNLNHSRTGIAP